MATTLPSAGAAARTGLFTTAQAAHVILGGTETATYWGIEFGQFVRALDARMHRLIGDPAEAPWRNLVDFTAQDYVELVEAVRRLDFVRDPAARLDERLAIEFARRSEILAVHGRAGAGKATIAAALEPYGFVCQRFADPIAASLALAYGMPLRFLTDRALEHARLPGSTLTPAKLMQLWGTEVTGGVLEGIWTKRALLRAASPMHDLLAYAANAPRRLSPLSGIRLCIPDVRRAEEADFIRNLGGRIIVVERAAAGPAAAEPAGAGINRSPTDIHIVNEGPLAQFQARAGQMLAEAAGAAPDRKSPAS